MAEEDQGVGGGVDASPAETTVSEINRRHVSASDKFFRMFAGASTYLVGLDGDSFELETTLDGRGRRVSIDQLVHNIADAWRTARGLESCRRCRVHLRQSSAPTGFAVNAKEATKQGAGGVDALAEIAMAFVEQARRAHDAPKPLVAIYEFETNEDGAMTRSSVQRIGDGDTE